jgi:hypothetical protein
MSYLCICSIYLFLNRHVYKAHIFFRKSLRHDCVQTIKSRILNGENSGWFRQCIHFVSFQFELENNNFKIRVTCPSITTIAIQNAMLLNMMKADTEADTGVQVVRVVANTTKAPTATDNGTITFFVPSVIIRVHLTIYNRLSRSNSGTSASSASDYEYKGHYSTNERAMVRVPRDVIRAPTPPPVIQRVVERAPTPEPDIVERVSQAVSVKFDWTAYN